MRPTLLVDGDLIVHRCTEAHTEAQSMDTQGDLWTYITYSVDAYHDFADRVVQMRSDVGADEVVIAFSTHPNWRHDVLPSYKSNRKAQRKPPGFLAVKQKVAEHFEVVMKPGLEGDDILGILATHPDLIEAKDRIIWSDDKDMRGVPCTLVKTDGIPFDVTTEEADRFHLIQTLMGDVTDGYTGCPGIGITTAEELLQRGEILERYEHTLKSGPRKGETETRVRSGGPGTPWQVVVSAYEATGLTEADALVQARVARILRWDEYDYDRGEPILWTPR